MVLGFVLGNERWVEKVVYILLVNNQLDAQLFFLICLLQFSACFEQSCAHHQDSQMYQHDIWYMSLCIGDRLVCMLGWNIEINV